MKKQIAKYIAIVFAIMVYISLFYGTYLASIYLLKVSLGIYDIEERVNLIENEMR